MGLGTDEAVIPTLGKTVREEGEERMGEGRVA